MWIEYVYDKEAKALYLYLYDRSNRKKVIKTLTLDDWISADFNFRNEIIGIEILEVFGIRAAKDEDRDNPE